MGLSFRDSTLGADKLVLVPFDFMDRSHVYVRIGVVGAGPLYYYSGTNLQWVNDAQLTVVCPASCVGLPVRIYRSTPQGIVPKLEDGVIDASVLNSAFRQLLLISQELRDNQESSVADALVSPSVSIVTDARDVTTNLAASVVNDRILVQQAAQGVASVRSAMEALANNAAAGVTRKLLWEGTISIATGQNYDAMYQHTKGKPFATVTEMDGSPSNLPPGLFITATATTVRITALGWGTTSMNYPNLKVYGLYGAVDV